MSPNSLELGLIFLEIVYKYKHVHHRSSFTRLKMVIPPFIWFNQILLALQGELVN